MIKCGVYTVDRVVKEDAQHRPIYWVIFQLDERIFYILEKECKPLYSTKFYLKLSLVVYRPLYPIICSRVSITILFLVEAALQNETRLFILK